MNKDMTVREAAREPLGECELSDGRTAMFERDNSETCLRGYTVEVRP